MGALSAQSLKISGLPVTQIMLLKMYVSVSMVKFIPLTKLPSTKETAEIMLNHVVHVYGFHKNILSQFIAEFWEEPKNS